MEEFIRIRNQRELEKFQTVNMTQDDCGLVRKVLITNGIEFNEEILKSLNCEDQANLLTIQFTTNKDKEAFNFESAKNLIKLQKENNIKNKILLVPIETTLNDFKKLQSEFENEKFTLCLFPEMEIENIILILDYCKNNKNIQSIEFIERDLNECVGKILEIGLLYSNYFTMGLTNIRLNSNLKYGGTTPEIFYASAGYKYFSKQIFLHAGPPKDYKIFNSETLKYEVLNEKEILKLKNIYGSKWIDRLYCENFLSIHKSLRKFSLYSKEDIQKILDLQENKVNAYFFCNKALLPKYLMIALERNLYFDILTMNKKAPIPCKNNSYLPEIEYIVFLRSKGVYWNGKLDYKLYFKSHSVITNGVSNEHPTQKPISIIKKFIQLSSDENHLVLDCFMGSGTTAIACKDLNRRFIGFEINEDYFKLANKRLKAEVKTLLNCC